MSPGDDFPLRDATMSAGDARSVAASVAAELRDLYGPRLRKVVLFGSWARGEGHAESDLDLLVVLDEVPSAWKERKRMDDVLWRHSLEHGIVVSAIPVAQSDLSRRSPFLLNAQAEGVLVA